MGRIFGRWLLASVALGAVSGSGYGVLIASTLGSPDETALVAEAPVALVLGIGLGLGSLFGVIVGVGLGAVLGVMMATINRRANPSTAAQYVRRIQILAVLTTAAAGVLLLSVIGRLLTLDVLPVLAAAAIWGLAARRIAEGYRGSWPVANHR